MSREALELGFYIFVGPVIAALAIGYFAIYVPFYADCTSIGWLPVTSIPSRCLTGDRR